MTIREPLCIGRGDDRIIFRCISCETEKAIFRLFPTPSCTMREGAEEWIESHCHCKPGLVVFTETESVRT